MAISDRQREIIEAALALISEEGIQALTMKRIAAAVGVSEPAIYRHFASKSEILAAVVDEMELSRAKALDEARESGDGAGGTLIAFFESHARLFMRRPAMTTILFSEDVFRSDPALLSRIDAIMAATQGTIRAEIEKDRGSGAFRQEMDAENMALMLVGGFRLLVSIWRIEKHSFNLAMRTSTYIRSALLLFQA
ncbi:MAG: TetR/AcrR family transcriptional regulator [Spirochaetes bacterium]|nr:TetR/AcrR family transcriptional regulator [Spirochaetota bacterium]